ncbi:SbcC/MukB-like Walker B domain-containing protein [Lipingzhangella sp. LS1_29]|uniref:SbcC/MukB-like Walker B domain-containing protein n=1 Tax=Lipingzhangella rawalii TaxID=2055835 RepID=A0ABU2H4R0_9ACTN|nr:SbcC/MukB-like Walker B domain-containing protein [Lipingzhangella rawalii]MDS1270297.1 SbcC/MukB-like Walker B domain-containing protein [Lipingzhangella rawalii]
MTGTDQLIAGTPTVDGTPGSARYRLTRAGIHNVWQYADQTFQFADGRLLLRGRNGAGKSKALEMLLPFLLDGDPRRLDTTGSGRTGLRWLMRQSRRFDDGPLRGYVWVEFVAGTEDDAAQRRTLGCAISAVPEEDSVHPVFFVTELRVGEDLHLLDDTDGPLSLDHLQDAVGANNCYRDGVSYRARVMQELFGLDDPVRYRNLVHLLHRLRRPTIGERIEAGELVSVLAEALPPTDETILDTLAQHLAALDAARGRLHGLRAAAQNIDSMLTDYREYLRGALRSRADEVRGHLDTYADCAATVERLRTEVEECRATESARQEERDRLRRTRDTATADDGSLAGAAAASTAPTTAEQQAHQAAIGAYARAAEAAAAGTEHARAAESHAEQHLAATTTVLHQQLDELRQLHGTCRDAAHAAGLDLTEPVPQPGTSVLAARESRTLVDLEGLEHSVEREPVTGIDAPALRAGLSRLAHDIDHLTTRATERREVATRLHADTDTLAQARRRATALRDEAEWLDGQLEMCLRREQQAHEDVRSASDSYTTAVRDWIARVRTLSPDSGLDLTALEARVALPPDGTPQPHPTDLPATVTKEATEILRGLVGELLELRDANVAEQRELGSELDDLAARKRAQGQHTARHSDAPVGPSGGEDDGQSTAELDRRIAIAEALLAETRERHTEIAERHDQVAGLLHVLPSGADLLSAWAVATNATDLRAAAAQEARASAQRADAAQTEVQNLEAEVTETAHHHGLPADGAALARVLSALTRTEATLTTLRSGTRSVIAAVDRYSSEVATWQRLRADRIAAEDGRTAAIQDMISVRRDIELTDRARTASPEQIQQARTEVRGRGAEAGSRLPELERAAQDARDARVAVETRYELAERELATAADRALAAGTEFRALLGDPEPDEDLLHCVGASDLATHTGTIRAFDAAISRSSGPDGATESDGAGEAPASARSTALTALRDLVDAVVDTVQRADPPPAHAPATAGAGDDSPDHAYHSTPDDTDAPDDVPDGAAAVAAATESGQPDEPAGSPPRPQPTDAPEGRTTPDDNDILRGYELLSQRLADIGAEVNLRVELGETRAVKRLRIVDDHGTHDISRYASHLADAISEAEKNVRLREDEAYERQLLGELAGHLYRQITEARSLVATMNEVLGEVTTSQGIGARLDWQLAADADSDISAVVPLLECPPDQRSRLETTRLRDALRRCIEAIRRLDPGASHGAQLRAALDYRSWFTFTVYVAGGAQDTTERPLTGRTALSQGEQRVIAYLVLFAAAAAQFGSLAQHAPQAPRLILLDDAFAKVDEPTHGRLLGLLAELDLDFVLTSERLWGCFASVPSLHIYECMRDPQVPGIATLHFSWDGRRRRLLGE